MKMSAEYYNYFQCARYRFTKCKMNDVGDDDDEKDDIDDERCTNVNVMNM